MARCLIRNVSFQIQKRFLQSSGTLSSVSPSDSIATSSSSSTVQFLVNSCGLSLNSALSLSKEFQLDDKTPRNPQSVLQFLKSHHFSDTLIAQLIVKRPITLNSRVEGNLRPKFEYLIKNGFQGELLHHLILSHPRIMGFSLDSRIKPSFEFLRMFVESNEKILQAVRRSPFLLTVNLKTRLQPTIDFLMKEGVSAHLVVKFLTSQPRSMFLKRERFVNAVNIAKNFGFEPSEKKFLQAVFVVIQMTESTWKKKIEVVKDMGFTEEEVLKAFKRDPTYLKLSEDNIRKSVGFFLNFMKMETRKLFANPSLLHLSIEKRVLPRYNVAKVLQSKGLVKGITKTVTYLLVTEKDFLKKYVDKYSNDVPGLMQIYVRTKEAKLVIA